MNKTFVFPIIILIIISFSGCSQTKEVPKSANTNSTAQKSTNNLISVSSREFNNLISSKSPSDIVLDVRTIEEFSEGHIQGAKLMDFYKENYENDLALLDKNVTYYIYCRSGNRSGETLELMKKLGFKNVYNLNRGINDWNSKGYKITIK